MSSEISAVPAIAVPPSGDGFRASFLPVAAPATATASPVPSPVAADREQIAQAVGELTEYVQKAGAELNFRIDEDSGRVIVSLVDAADGTVLLQLPSEEALRIAKLLSRCEPCLIEAEA